jgi:hypothetical protein
MHPRSVFPTAPNGNAGDSRRRMEKVGLQTDVMRGVQALGLGMTVLAARAVPASTGHVMKAGDAFVSRSV